MSLDHAAVVVLGVASRFLKNVARGPFQKTVEALDHSVVERRYQHAYRLFSSHKNTPIFMNYGIKVPVGEAPKLEAADEPDRLFIQMYHRAIAGIDLKDLDVLEVSSGHGGGSRYVAHYLHPRRMVGVDINDRAVDLCRARHSEPGLEYTVGNAVDLSFPDNSFDAVINIEASHRYPSFETFLREVHRVLRPGGYLMFVDLRWEAIPNMLRALQQSGMAIVSNEYLTSKVVASLDEFASKRRALLAEIFPANLLQEALDSSAMPGSPLYQALAEGRATYQRFLLRKPSV